MTFFNYTTKLCGCVSDSWLGTLQHLNKRDKLGKDISWHDERCNISPNLYGGLVKYTLKCPLDRDDGFKFHVIVYSAIANPAFYLAVTSDP